MASVLVWLPSAAAVFSSPVVPKAVHAFRYSSIELPLGCPVSTDAGQIEVRESPKHSFGRALRLLKPADYKRVFDGATRLSTRYLTLLACPNNLGQPRLGLAISRKIIKNAVDRNRIKRQIRESFRLNQETLGGIDVVLMVRSGVESWNWLEFRSTLDNKWQDLHKKCKNC